MDKVTEFNEAEFNNAYPDGVNNNYWSRARNEIIYNTLKQYKLHTNNVIEIGCGRGGVVSFLHDKGVNILGVELAPCTPFEEAKDLILTGTNALTLDKQLRDNYETLLLLDVIEHIEHPDLFLKEIIYAYPNLKHILITVPARKEIWSNYDEYYGHFTRYDYASLDLVLQKSKCTPLLKSYAFRLLYGAARAMSFTNAKRSVVIKAPEGSLSLFIHRILGAYFQTEYKLLPQKWRGSSLICLAKIERN